jgi:hypothetical protein
MRFPQTDMVIYVIVVMKYLINFALLTALFFAWRYWDSSNGMLVNALSYVAILVTVEMLLSFDDKHNEKTSEYITWWGISALYLLLLFVIF